MSSPPPPPGDGPPPPPPRWPPPPTPWPPPATPPPPPLWPAPGPPRPPPWPPPSPAAPRSRRALVLGTAAGLLLLALVVVAATLASYRGGVSIGELRPGDCFSTSDGLFGARTHRVACRARHRDEVAGVLTAPAGPGEPYPGLAGILELGRRECPRLVAEFLGPEPPAAADTFVFGPSEPAWRRGERAVVCSLRAPDAAKRIGSFLDR